MNKVIEVNELSHYYKIRKELRREVLIQVNLVINDSDWISITGPSGSGKTTLLKILSGLIKPTSGNINHYIESSEIIHTKQNPNLPDYLTVKEILLDTSYNLNRANEIIDTLQIKHLQNKYIDELSGGELKTVNLGRAMMCESSLLLLDEPTVNLDDENTNLVLEAIKKLNQNGKAIIIASHKGNVVNAAKKIYKLTDHQLVDAPKQ